MPVIVGSTSHFLPCRGFGNILPMAIGKEFSFALRTLWGRERARHRPDDQLAPTEER